MALIDIVGGGSCIELESAFPINRRKLSGVVFGQGKFYNGRNEEVGETCRVPKQISLINKPFQLGLIEYLLNSVAATCLLIKIIFCCKEEEPFQKVQ